ncbi:hypothetical protein [Xylophilus ampelinus]|uniref:Serine hydroxymethyltransferase n=1 Tax=Xylophilus ampelinus TaxID=54067 RepID=A0A318SEK7_9BURK|nr:hypothetical protein [Xylophilus ampelinus]MCS4510898.1 hypothetical protein [Xylophilus ampelinus]PYE76057.1 serine hydroxymethyltransferase [Xylophilus ampelinus]
MNASSPASVLRPSHESVLSLVRSEQKRRRRTISLTANENVLSNTARMLGTGPEYDRYYFNCRFPINSRYAGNYNGMEVESFPEIDMLKLCASHAAAALFGAPYVEYRVLSGVHCTISSIASLTKAGQAVISIASDSGGHFATPHIVEKLGRRSLGLRLNGFEFDLDALKRTIAPVLGTVGMVLIDHGMTTSPIPVRRLRSFLDEWGLARIPIIYDASHTLGLIAGGVFPNPLDEAAAVLQGNTHKSFPGPHRALMLTRDERIFRQLSEGISFGFTSSPGLHSLIELFVSLLEMERFAGRYAARMIDNASLITDALCGEQGWAPQATATHMVLVQSDRSAAIVRRLNEFGIRANNKVLDGRSYIRLGTQEVTRLGIDADELACLCELIGSVGRGLDGSHERRLFNDIACQLRRVHYSFDEQQDLHQ